MYAALKSHERDRDQREHHDQDNALLIFGELKNPEQAFHSRILQIVILSGAKSLRSFFLHGRPQPRDVSLRSTSQKSFYFFAYRIGSFIPTSRNPLSRRRQESHSPQATPSGDGS